MKFLADENLESLIVEWLREQGHDVLYAAEVLPSEEDPDLLGRASAEGRVLITNDLDFGELVYRQRLFSVGVVLLRLRGATDYEQLAGLQERWNLVEPDCVGHFVVVKQKSVRVRPLPSI